MLRVFGLFSVSGMNFTLQEYDKEVDLKYVFSAITLPLLQAGLEASRKKKYYVDKDWISNVKNKHEHQLKKALYIITNPGPDTQLVQISRSIDFNGVMPVYTS